ncbi:diaminopropionate ammonia-lyase [Deinococcus peraridilitoris]|uniref:Threonine dehydratase n=1 Tax=Deinococcus peraridilitoris (strain DSM 19664 / LMG 22246 / CIP 109416 / KR-200) TaxID=937777 RepID=L0A7K7_DEIPD|nr:diaminopropionate ammonia-lyase [Deinococcus peraridilitoris]AFZ69434.1 threonine dehydratase [Deinococcus peraridilitoris DSM 19664]
MNTERARLYWNEHPQRWGELPDADGLGAFHARLPGYAPTPLRAAPSAARQLGVRQVWVKDESDRLGLPAYKILGASWATYRALEARFGPFQPWCTLEELSRQLRAHLPLELVCATDGNHGRAVARMARWLGLNARILVPADMASARVDAIAQEGATVQVVRGTYDDAVMQAARLVGERSLVISDTAWEGYEQIPRCVVEGYATIFREIDGQLAVLGEAPPEVVAAQMGVGALAASVVRHYRRAGASSRVVGVEPTRAPCVLESVLAGGLVSVPGPHDSIMAGLNCGRPSPVAWPWVSQGIDAFLAVPDERAREAMRLLARDGIVSGESGAAGLAGFIELFTGAGREERRERLGLTADSALLVISTEGATDPVGYARVVGQVATRGTQGLS